MSDDVKAVFLSYASQDTEAARKICDTLRAAGVEVWFDQAELVGGDEWDAKIRRQIRECALFVPMISANTNARTKGYFRREWKLAVECTYDLADGIAFIVPVILDDTSERGALVPDAFLKVQWTRVRDGIAPAGFVQHVRGLLGVTTPLPAPTPTRNVGGNHAPVPATTAAKKDSAAQNGAPPRRDKSIAVLAFANLTRDPDNEYFSDGITEELLNVLAKVAGLRVTARTSAFFFKGKNVPIQEIAEKLGVGYVVEGSVRRSGNRVRITAQLIDAADGFHLWSENFDRELEDIFAVQDEIAGLIARHLELTLGQGARAARAVNPEAHRLVLEGRFYWNQRSEEGFRRATAAFTRALECDPEFAPALAGRADVAMMRANYRLIDGHKDVAALWDELTRDARAALELEPQAAEPHVALMYMHLMRGEFAAAESEHRQWEQLNPNCPGGRLFAGAVFAAQGRLDRATHELETAAGLDPLGVVVANVQVEMLLWSGQHQRALELNERAVGLRADVFPPNLGMRAALLAGLGRGGDAVEAARALRRAAGFKPRWWYDPEAIFALHRGGQAAEAAEYLAAMRPAWPEGSYLEGLALAALGRFDEALPFLARTPVVAFKELYWTRILDPFRGEPRFAQLIAGLGCAKEYQLARETFTRLNAR